MADYVLQGVTGLTALQYANLSGSLGFPSSWNRLLTSLWVCLNSATASASFFTNTGNSALWDLIVHPTTTSLYLYNSSTPAIFMWTHPSIEGTAANVLATFDTLAQTAELYINNSPATPTSVSTITGFHYGPQVRSGVIVGNPADSSHPPAIADYWVTGGSNAYDLSDPAIRAKFIAPNGAAVDLGSNGQTPFGFQPQIFLHQDSTDPVAAHFAINKGSGGGTSTVVGNPLILEPSGYCIGPPAPVGPLPPPSPPPPPPPVFVPQGVWVEILRPLFEVEDNLYDAWFVDGSDVPSSAQTANNGTRFFGFNHLLGQAVSVWSGGLDCGDFVVQVGGFVDVPYGSANGLYTAAYLSNLVESGYDGTTNVVLLDGVTPIPAVVGKTYTSSGQIVRPASPADTGARNGPGQGKTRRNHMMTALLQGTQGISFGTDFQHVFPFQPALYVDGPVLPVTQLYSGVYWDTLDDTYTFDGMVCWTVGRPYPASVVNIGGFIQTTDR